MAVTCKGGARRICKEGRKEPGKGQELLPGNPMNKPWRVLSVVGIEQGGLDGIRPGRLAAKMFVSFDGSHPAPLGPA